MPDYVKMYHKLFNAQTDAIRILQEAQQDAEEMYLSAPDTGIHIVDFKKQADDEPGEKNDKY